MEWSLSGDGQQRRPGLSGFWNPSPISCHWMRLGAVGVNGSGEGVPVGRPHLSRPRKRVTGGAWVGSPGGRASSGKPEQAGAEAPGSVGCF